MGKIIDLNKNYATVFSKNCWRIILNNKTLINGIDKVKHRISNTQLSQSEEPLVTTLQADSI